MNYTAKEAILQGISPDGGLFVSDSLGKHQVDLQAVPGASYQDLAAAIMGQLLDGFSPDELKTCIDQAYSSNFDTPLITPVRHLQGNSYVLELFHGPTCAFKDLALQILPGLMSVAQQTLQTGEKDKNREHILILTATSGDTGKAAMAGFADAPHTGIVVFYPAGKVSRIQQLQMVTQSGSNVQVCAVEGNFDDAQSAVKSIFTDQQVADRLQNQSKAVLSSANSINIGRLMPQVVYYYAAYGHLLEAGTISRGDPVDFIVPTGNFGDILAGYYAKVLGLPVGKLVVASDKNKVLYDFLTTGVYDTDRDFYTTTSPSMDILISSNLERMLYYFSHGNTSLVASLMKDLALTGHFRAPDSLMEAIREVFDCFWADEDQVQEAIASCYQSTGYLLDPHTACAYHALEQRKKQNVDSPRGKGNCQITNPQIIVATASPFKFPRVALEALRESGKLADKADLLASLAQDDAMALSHLRSLSDFDCLDLLEKVTGLTAPDQLKNLKNKQVRFTDSLPLSDMRDYVIQAAQKFWPSDSADCTESAKKNNRFKFSN